MLSFTNRPAGRIHASTFLFRLAICGLLSLAGLQASALQERPVDLTGTWRFALDRTDAGMRESWFERRLTEEIRLPGGLTEQGIGDPVTVDTKWIGGIVDKSWFTAPEYARYRDPANTKIPFWLQPTRYYAGAAWFQRDIDVPKAWAGRRIVLFLERPHWETRVWVDSQLYGTNNSLSTPHEYDLGQLSPGRHQLTLCVDNRLVVDVGENSHSVSDQTQGNWNGVVGRIELRSTGAGWIDDLQVYPDLKRGRLRVDGLLATLPNQPASPEQLIFTIEDLGSRQQMRFTKTGDDFQVGTHGRLGWRTNSATGTIVALTPYRAELSMGWATNVWDEFHPSLYRLTATLVGADGVSLGSKSTTYGLRDLSKQATQFELNGHPIFFRGTLECCIFPKTGHPPTDVTEWKRILLVAKAHGLNMIRFHSWCPPEAAFVAADEVGFYYHVECGSWANQSTSLGDGKPIDQWIYAEADRILKNYGNHPSFMLLLYGNEPRGVRHKAFLTQWVQHYKSVDPRRLVSSGAGWPALPVNDFHVVPNPRIQSWGGGLKSRFNARPPDTTGDYRDYISQQQVPVISHEIGQWCVYPNFQEIKKYTGYLKPRNFEIFQDRLVENGMGRLAQSFLFASGKLQALCYKEEIEAALRTPGMGGFQLLDLHDFPGQGTALVGVLDPFWEQKGYVTPAEFRRFCNAVVPLVRLPQRVFTTDERMTASVELANFGPAPLKDAVVEWKVRTAQGKTYAHGELTIGDVPWGNGASVGQIAVDWRQAPAPRAYKLELKVRGTAFANDWDLWVYPASLTQPAQSEVLVTSQFDSSAQEQLRAGRKVLLTIPGPRVKNFDTAPVKLGFSSIFWNTAWTSRQAPTTLGILCDPGHPALRQFPTEGYSTWQWWYLIHRAGALRLDLLPVGTSPIVRLIDDWFTARPLGLVVEGRVGKGKLVVCGFDLTEDADDPVSRQMRTSLVSYLESKACRPSTEFTAEQVQALIGPEKPLK